MGGEEEREVHHEEAVVGHGELDDLDLHLKQLRAIVVLRSRENADAEDEPHEDSQRHRGHQEEHTLSQEVVLNFPGAEHNDECDQKATKRKECG